MSFLYLSHTADLRAEIRGDNQADLYSAALDLVRDALVGDSPVRDSHVRELSLDAADDGERLFRLLRELVYLYDAEAFLPHRLERWRHSDGPLRVFGEPFDPQRHRSERQIKAVTRHDYIFERDADGYRAVVLFDL